MSNVEHRRARASSRHDANDTGERTRKPFDVVRLPRRDDQRSARRGVRDGRRKPISIRGVRRAQTQIDQLRARVRAPHDRVASTSTFVASCRSKTRTATISTPGLFSRIARPPPFRVRCDPPNQPARALRRSSFRLRTSPTCGCPEWTPLSRTATMTPAPVRQRTEGRRA